MEGGSISLASLTSRLGNGASGSSPRPLAAAGETSSLNQRQGVESRKSKAVLGARRHAHPQAPGLPPGLVAVWGVRVKAEATF